MVSASINFYEPNKLDDGCTYAFTTADTANANFLYDRTSITQLTSVASGDGTNEKLLITFASPQYIDKLAVLGHNIKTGNLKYLNVSLAETAFSSAIAWTSNTTLTNEVFSVTQVLAYGLALNIANTIDAGQKKVGQLLALELAGTMNAPNTIDPYLKIKKNTKEKVDGGVDKLVQGKKHGATMEFDNMTTADKIVYIALADRGEPFYLNLSELSTTKDSEFFRLQDWYLVNMTNDPEPELYQALMDIHWGGTIEWLEV